MSGVAPTWEAPVAPGKGRRRRRRPRGVTLAVVLGVVAVMLFVLVFGGYWYLWGQWKPEVPRDEAVAELRATVELIQTEAGIGEGRIDRSYGDYMWGGSCAISVWDDINGGYGGSSLAVEIYWPEGAIAAEAETLAHVAELLDDDGFDASRYQDDFGENVSGHDDDRKMYASFSVHSDGGADFYVTQDSCYPD
ncbi:MAG: hypothetical protein SGJ13_14200 [Actinomycetota bacterium]|nr:hypothetical protein [Actinomycetota bacterium]